MLSARNDWGRTRMATRENLPAAAANPDDSPAGVHRSALSPEALRAAEQADEIPIEGKWWPGLTLITIIGCSGALWGLFMLARHLLGDR